MLKETEETGCCKRFDPAPWKDTLVNFNDRLFIKDRVRSIFHIPLNFGKVMKRNTALIASYGATPAAPLMLSDESSLWGSDVYIAVTKEIPGTETARIKGDFLSRVYEGPFSEMSKWIRDMTTFVQSKGKTAKKFYFYYTTCPACAKAYGKNYIVILASV